MNDGDNSLDESLQEQLQQFTEKATARSPETMATVRNGIEALAQAGVGKHALREGAQAPDFALPNVRGETVKLSDLLTHGPVVVAFYRGTW